VSIYAQLDYKYNYSTKDRVPYT